VRRSLRAALALFGVDRVPVRARAIEETLTAAAVDDLDLQAIGAEVAASLDPPGDLHASGEQRRKMAKTLVPRVLAAAIDEANHA
jgi:CO/xanthine dehydrogenase FAD-binding subunit